MMKSEPGFEVSVDTRTKGLKLDNYTVRRSTVNETLLDPDLLKLPVELTITTGGVFGRGGSAVLFERSAAALMY